MKADPNEAHFDWPVGAGEPAREVWYSLVSSRDGSVAFWYRYTLLSTESGRREGRVWAALTDRDEPSASTFHTASSDLAAVDVDDDPFSLRIGGSTLSSTAADGSVDDVTWRLAYEPDRYVFTPLRSEQLTDMLSKTMGTGKHWSRNQSVFMDGEITVGDRTIALSDAPGHQGHTVSFRSPPDDWTWVQCNDFAENDSAVLEALRLDDKLSLCFRMDGEVYPLNRVHHLVPSSPKANETLHDEVGAWRFAGQGEGIDLEATVEAPPNHWQTVAYMVPDDSLRYNAHCSVSNITVTVSVDGGERQTLTSDSARAEWVGVEPPIAATYLPDWE